MDVPSIGEVYHYSKVVCYFGGLGRPFNLKANDLESDRCWFNRAWTLQEASEEIMIGGDTDDEGAVDDDIQRWLPEQLSLLRKVQGARNVFHVLSQMQSRVSTNNVDKVAGLAYLVGSVSIPAYYEKQSEEDAWTALVNVMWKYLREQLLFAYPGPGDRKQDMETVMEAGLN